MRHDQLTKELVPAMEAITAVNFSKDCKAFECPLDSVVYRKP